MTQDLEYVCRVCGYVYDEPTWAHGSGSQDLCLCCNVHFGYEDGSLDAVREYRKPWADLGHQWAYPSKRPPGWDVRKQLENIPAEWR